MAKCSNICYFLFDSEARNFPITVTNNNGLVGFLHAQGKNLQAIISCGANLQEIHAIEL